MPSRHFILLTTLLCSLLLLTSCAVNRCAVISGVTVCGIEPVCPEADNAHYSITICYSRDSEQNPGNHPLCDKMANEQIRKLLDKHGYANYEILDVACFQTVVSKCKYKVKLY